MSSLWPILQELQPGDRPWLRRTLTQRFGSARVVSRGRLHHADELPGFTAWLGRDRAGALTYRLCRTSAREGRLREIEIVALDVSRPGLGVGPALLDAAIEKARLLGCGRVWLVTTNDNLPAIRLYERRGLRLAAVRRGAVRESRRLKPEIPFVGQGGVLIEDELEFELLL